MARLWTCGFEMQSITAGVEWSVGSGAATVGTPTISTTIKRRGTAAIRFNPAAATQYIEMQPDAGAVKRTFHRFYLYIATLPTADVNIYGIGQSGYFPGVLRLKTNGTLTLRDGFTSVDLGTASAPLQTGRWYRVELDYTDVAGTAGTVTGAFRGYLDGALFADTLCSNVNSWSRVRIGPQTNTTCDIYIDDVAVNDSTGTVQNGLPGAGCVVHLLPNGAGDSNLWDVAVGGIAGAANNWTRVAQRTPDDAVSYNQTASTGTTTVDDFNVAAAADAGIGTADQINVVQVGGRLNSDATTAASIVYRLKSQAGGAVQESGSVSVNVVTWQTNNASTPRFQRLTSYADPQDGTAWTAAKLDTAQVGYRTNISQTTIRRISGVWLVVDFVPRYALGVAQDIDDAHALVYNLPADPTFTLQDDFDDNVVDYGKWPNSFGYHVEAGGRAQIGVDENYNAYSSAKRYKLLGSKVIVQPLPPPMPEPETAEAWMQLLILSSVAGTDLGWSIEIRTGEISAFSRTGYYDPEAPYLTYDPVAHAWFKVEEADGTITWSTAPDGHTWTVRRSVATPAWVTSGRDLEVQMISHRGDGTPNYCEWDNFNVLPLHIVQLGAASTSNTARSVTRRKTVRLGHATSAAQGRPIQAAKHMLLGGPTSLAGAQPVRPSKTEPLGAATGRDVAALLRVNRRVAIGPAQSTASAAAGAASKSMELGNPARTDDQASPVSTRKRVRAGAPVSTHAGHPLRVGRRVGGGSASSVDRSHPIGTAKLEGLAAATSVDRAWGLVVRKSAALGTAVSGATAEGLAARRRYRAAQAVSQALGGALVARKRAHADPAASREAAWALQVVSTDTLGHSVSTSSGHAVRPTKHDPRSTPATDVSTGHALSGVKRLMLGSAIETASARPPAGRRKLSRLGAAAATQSGAGVEAAKSGRLGSAQSSATAHSLSVLKRKLVGRATETSRAWPLFNSRATLLEIAPTADTASPLVVLKTRQFATCAAADSAAGVAGSKLRSTGSAEVTDRGTVLVAGKRMSLGVAREVSEVRGTPLAQLNRLLAGARASDRAHALNVYKQQPADRLVPGWIEPGLTSTSHGPGLRAQSIRPGLSTGYTTGGS